MLLLKGVFSLLDPTSFVVRRKKDKSYEFLIGYLFDLFSIMRQYFLTNTPGRAVLVDGRRAACP